MDDMRLCYIRTLTIFYEVLPAHRAATLASIEWALKGVRVTVIRGPR